MLVIGLVGEKGSGKGTFAATLERIVQSGTRIARVRMSDVLRETLDLWHLPHTRANLQTLSKAMDTEFGNGTLAHAIGHRIAAADASIVIVDGVRWEADRLLLRSFGRNLLVYVTASPRIRYERTCARGENAMESSTTFAQFLEEERATSEQAIPRIGVTADATIVNGGTIEEFTAAIRACYEQHIVPRCGNMGSRVSAQT